MRKLGIVFVLVALVLTLYFVNLYAAPVVVGNFTVDYVISSDWGSGATINVTLKNDGPAVQGWTVGWVFPGNQTITNMWGATYTQSGASVTAKNVDYNGSLPTGGSQSFGFNANYSGTNVAPTSFTVNSSSTTTPTPIRSVTPTPTQRGVTPTPTRTVTVTPTPTRAATPTQGPTPPPVAGDLIRVEPLPGTKINSTFWNARIKNMITTWIPYCYNQLSNTSLAEGGIDNFVQAGRKLTGQSYKAHVGYWFSNAYVHNTVEAMCYAIMIDPQGDSAIISAQNAMKSKLDDWIPKILSAAESDGYLHTWTTLGNNARWTDRAAHEGYTAGYFLEAAIAHYLMTNRTDARLYNAAKKLATCWVNNKPGNGQWWDGHQEMEQALTRFGVFVKGVEGGTLGDTYINCAKRLMDVRYSGSSGQYDQSHAYPVNQTSAVGHAGCGNMFFNNNMFQWTKNGKYVDVMQLALYNNVLGALNQNANLFTYTNSLDTSSARYTWHNCPCCVGNIPRTILSLMKWTYAKTSNSIYVNMYVGSTFTVTGVAGTNVQMVQTTNYPWENTVTITVNPSTSANFTIYLHSPDRSVSACYSSSPGANGISSITVNGSAVSATASNGFVAINRTWVAGDKIVLTLPLAPQRVKAVSNVSACSGRVALQYGPLIYNIESVDQDVNLILNSSSALSAVWNGSLLGGVMTIKGTFTSGAAMTAIPNYARLNRGGRSLVWLRDQ